MFRKIGTIAVWIAAMYGFPTTVEAMSSLTFVPPDHPVLKMQSKEVPVEQIESPEIQELIDEMLLIAQGERIDLQKGVLVGLAAPQLGIPKRVILVDIGRDSSRQHLGQLNVYINPVILWKSDEVEDDREGCYSAGCLQAIVSRAAKVRILAYDRSGRQIIEEFQGLTARIFQHEIDHLDGIRFPDRIGPEGRLLWVEDDDYEEFRSHWQTWSKTCPFSAWLEMRGG